MSYWFSLKFSGAPARQAWRPKKQMTFENAKTTFDYTWIIQYLSLQHYLQAVYNCLLSKLLHVTWHNTWSRVKIVCRDCAERHRHLHKKLYCYSMTYCNRAETDILLLTEKIWLCFSSNSSMVLGLSAPVRHGRIMFGGIEFLKSNNNKDAKRQHTHAHTHLHLHIGR